MPQYSDANTTRRCALRKPACSACARARQRDVSGVCSKRGAPQQSLSGTRAPQRRRRAPAAGDTRRAARAAGAPPRRARGAQRRRGGACASQRVAGGAGLCEPRQPRRGSSLRAPRSVEAQAAVGGALLRFSAPLLQAGCPGRHYPRASRQCRATRRRTARFCARHVSSGTRARVAHPSARPGCFSARADAAAAFSNSQRCQRLPRRPLASSAGHGDSRALVRSTVARRRRPPRSVRSV